MRNSRRRRRKSTNVKDLHELRGVSRGHGRRVKKERPMRAYGMRRQVRGVRRRGGGGGKMRKTYTIKRALEGIIRRGRLGR